MPKKTDSPTQRDLTTQEYIVLGLISVRPQSGYSIMSFLDSQVAAGSASPGTIYPILKRLEARAAIQGVLEADYEMRPRKVYTLTAAGNTLLDNWLRIIPKMNPYYQEREIGLWKFEFMEGRLTKAEVLEWLNNYRDSIIIYEAGRRLFQGGTLEQMEALGVMATHQRLVMEAELMDLETLRTWLEIAQERVTTTPPSP